MEIENDWNNPYPTFDINDVGNYGAEHTEDILDLDDDDNIHNHPHGSDPTTGADGVLLMRFCPHDSSMLYPKEDRNNKQLLYACRLCQYTERATNPMIYKNTIKKEVKNVLHTVPGAISDDPTLPRSQNASCENCGHHEAVFFQSDTGQSDSLALIFVCCNCEHRWVK